MANIIILLTLIGCAWKIYNTNISIQVKIQQSAIIFSNSKSHSPFPYDTAERFTGAILNRNVNEYC
jgi:hypothetical protein